MDPIPSSITFFSEELLFFFTDVIFLIFDVRQFVFGTRKIFLLDPKKNVNQMVSELIFFFFL